MELAERTKKEHTQREKALEEAKKIVIEKPAGLEDAKKIRLDDVEGIVLKKEGSEERGTKVKVMGRFACIIWTFEVGRECVC